MGVERGEGNGVHQIKCWTTASEDHSDTQRHKCWERSSTSYWGREEEDGKDPLWLWGGWEGATLAMGGRRPSDSGEEEEDGKKPL